MEPWKVAANVTEAASACCLALVERLGGDKVYLAGCEAYKASLSSYYSQQAAEQHPAYIVSPTTPEDVSGAVRTLAGAGAGPESGGGCGGCPFSIRSGGHAGHGGGGVTLDLGRLNGIAVSADRATVSVGPGATWADVYAALDPLGLSVAGARAGQVGVGGLATGGGISYLSPRVGWTCDTVSNYQVVLADGSVVDARQTPELLAALRGASGNLGVVTRVDVDVLEQGPVWGGSVVHSLDTVDGQLRAFEAFCAPDGYDEYASLITSFGYAAGHGAAVVNSIEYTRAEERPPAFAAFAELPALRSTMRIAPMADIAAEQGSFAVVGARQLMAHVTHGATLAMLNASFAAWNASVAAVADVRGVVWSLSLEPLPPAMYRRGARSNSLGLGDRSGTLVVALLTATWTDRADDGRVEAAARRLGVHDAFVYVNYAVPWQDPLASYGRESVERLARVRAAVDPRGVFARAGGFKLSL